MAKNIIKDTFNLQDTGSFQYPEFHDQNIKHQNFDIELYEDLVMLSPVVKETLDDGQSKLKTFNNLSKDMFLSLFKYKPELRGKGEISPSRRFNHEMMSEFMETDEFKELRDVCKLDILNSTMGTEILQNKALDKINTIIDKNKEQEQENPNGDMPPDLLEQINDMVSQEDELKEDAPQPGDGDEVGDQAGDQSGSGVATDVEQGDQGNDGTDSGDGDMRLSSDAARKLAKLQSEMEQSTDFKQMEQQIQETLKRAANDALVDVKEMKEFVNAWGLDSESSPSRVSFDESRDALERIRNSPNLKDLTDIVGKFKGIANQQLKHKSKGDGHSVSSVTVGNKIERTLPSEKLLLTDRRTKSMFYKKHNEKQLLEYEMEEDKRKGMGPMIVCLDVSGSMNDNIRDVWGRAVSLALLEVAQKQKRDYALVMFSTRIEEQWIVKKGDLKPNIVLDIAEAYYGGGTSFDVPVTRALEIIDKEKEFHKADIVFITDGDCYMNDDTEKRLHKTKKEKNICIQTVIIDAGSYWSDDGVEGWSDKITNISDLAKLGDAVAEDIFSTAVDRG